MNDNAIRDAIFDILLSTFARSSPAEANAATIFPIRVWPGHGIDTKGFGNAWSPTNPSGSQAATENISMLVNVVPVLSANYTPSGATVEQVYGQVLDSAIPQTVSDEALAMVDAEIAARSDVDVTTPSGNRVHTVALTNGSQVHERLRSVASAFHEAKGIYARSALASVLNPGIQYHPSYLSPADWVSETFQGWAAIDTVIPGTTPAVRLTLKFARLEILRPWFAPSLFNLGGWKTDQGPGSLSTGSLEENPGIFPLLPTVALVTRDIVAETTGGELVFQSPGLQVLAWIARVVPYSPPKELYDKNAVTYRVAVETGNVWLAGTDANVYITLIGSKGTSEERLLDTPGHDDFEAGNADVFELVMQDVGDVRQVRIRHDNSGAGPGWFLNKITIQREGTPDKWVFPCSRWLATDEDDRKIDRLLNRA